MDGFHEVITVAIANGDMDILPALWNLTFTFSKDGATLRERIRKKIPDMTRLYGLRAVLTSSFPVLVKFWQTELVLREATSAQKALLELARSNDKTGILYILRSTPLEELDYQGIIHQLVIEDNLPVMIFFFKKVRQEHQRTTILEYFHGLLRESY